MTIKEMEERTGMSRTNIRFYEAEGLICPGRRENGYREYSEEDARTLMKVKLLRAMEVPLETVKAMTAGTVGLIDGLDALDAELDRQQLRQERARQASRQMRQENTAFDTLEPERYLPMLESGEARWMEDASPRLNLPWRRYWARGLDFSLYNTLVSLALRDFQNRVLFVPILTLLAMLVIEPILLQLFGTTFGKAVFGIRITDREGNRLDYDTGVERTWTVMWEGEALRIPLICQYFQYKSLYLAEQEIPLSWEGESELTYSDDKKWRYALFLAAHVALIWAELWILGG